MLDFRRRVLPPLTALFSAVTPIPCEPAADIDAGVFMGFCSHRIGGDVLAWLEDDAGLPIASGACIE